MGRRVGVVTDSTSCLPVGTAARLGIRIVALQVVMGGQVLDEGGGVSSAAVAAALAGRQPVSTSRPAPTAFLAAYRQVAASGADSVVSIHLSADMSGTLESAQVAARDAPIPVNVVDSRTLGMGLGYAALTAAAAAAAGASGEEVAAYAAKRAAASSLLVYVDTLEHLHRGGRIGAAAALLGSALSVKPLLEMTDGRLRPLDKVRTTSRALARLQDLAVERAGPAVIDLAVHHVSAAARASEVASGLRARVPGLRGLYLSQAGAVIAAHVGPGMIAVVVAPR